MTEIFIRMIGEADGFPMHEPWDVSVQGPIPEGAVLIPRLQEAFEEWIDGAWVLPANAAKARADWSVPAEHIAESHRQKRWEAMLIKMGLTPPDELSVLKGEAANRGITLEAMADIIAAKSAAFVAAELARQEPDIAAQKLAEGTKP